MLKKTVAIAAALALALLAVPGAFADDPFERFSFAGTYEEAIDRFPESLQSGFEAIWAALMAMGHPEERSLEILNSFVALHFVRVNIIEAGLEEVPFPNNEDVSYAEFYAEFRALGMRNLIHILPAVIVIGNPFGTDWDAWFEEIENYL